MWQAIDDPSVYDEELIWEKGWGGAIADLGRNKNSKFQFEITTRKGIQLLKQSD